MYGGLRTLGPVLAAILLAGPGCSRDDDEPPTAVDDMASPPAASDLAGAKAIHPSEPGFYFQPAEVLTSPLPTRFRGPLPSTTEQFESGLPVFESELRAVGSEEALVRLKHCITAVGTLDDWTREACLHRMARIDWAAAASLAGELRNDGGIPDVVQTLVAFPEPGQLERILRSTGVLPDHPDPERVDTLAITLPARLSRYGRLHWFEPGIAGDPGMMEWVLYECAAREPVLAEAVFEVAWRPADPYADQTEASRTAVFVDGTEYRFELAPFDDLDAVEKLVGLLNTVASERGSSTRFAPWSVSEDGIGVVMGPGAGLQSARDQGLVAYMTP